MRLFVAILIFISLTIAGFPSAEAKTALPLPRYVSMKSSESNVRAGPGVRYKIQWVIVRKGMPVEILAEFEQWRKIRDVQGDIGWVHRSMLSGQRRVVIKENNQLLRNSPSPDGRSVARTEAGVTGNLLACEVSMCQIKVDNIKGWIAKDAIWGVYPGEKF